MPPAQVASVDPHRERAHFVLAWTSLWILVPAYMRTFTMPDNDPLATWYWIG